MSTLIQRLEIAKDFAQTAFENTVNTVQTIHNTIANASYDLACQASDGNEKLKTLKQKHDQSASQVYNTIREVNRSLGQLASDYFETVEDSAEIDKTMTQNKK